MAQVVECVLYKGEAQSSTQVRQNNRSKTPSLIDLWNEFYNL
jgi:hypothetical protein